MAHLIINSKNSFLCAVMHSISKEDYLKAIYHLTNGKETLANTSKIAAYLNIKASSCTDMVKKLASDKLISYEPYRGVRLSPSGRKAAIYMIRKHRLWETFLVNTLGFNWDEVHNVAEQLEHTESPELITRLDAFLGHPTLDPHGDPIPDANGIVQNLEEKNLASYTPPADLTVIGVKDHSSEFFQALTERKIALGSRIRLLKVFDYDQSLVVEVDGQEQTLTPSICRNLVVEIKTE